MQTQNNYLTLIVTLNCKEKCPFCSIEKQDIALNEKTAKKAVSLFLNSTGETKTIKFFGGEPLLEFKLIKKLVCFAEDLANRQKKRVNFILATSGILLNKTILTFLLNHNCELNVNSYHLPRIPVHKGLIAFPLTNLTVNIPPSKAQNLFSEFKKFYERGFKRFNFLPHYYVHWPQESIKHLNVEFKKISDFSRKKPDIYFINAELKGDVPLFNNGLTCDPRGGLFTSNCVLFKEMKADSDALFLGNVNSMKNIDFAAKDILLPEIIKNKFDRDILSETFMVDRILGNFVDSLKITIFRADIKVGYSCNNNCLFCVQGRKRSLLKDKSTQDIFKTLHQARVTSNGVVLTGGEPSIRADFFQLLNFAKKLGYQRIQVQTNGRMFAYKDFCLTAIESGANEFGIALHGHIPQLHDYLTTARGSFSQTIKAITNLSGLNVPVYSNTVITKSNYRHLPEIARLLVYLRVKQFQFAFVHALGSAKDNFNSIVKKNYAHTPIAMLEALVKLERGERYFL